MKLAKFFYFLVLLGSMSCASIPRETEELSRMLGNDLVVLHSSHRNSVSLLFSTMKKEVNSFVDGTYAPFVIHYVLKQEMQAYNRGETSLYSTIELAGREGGEENTTAAIKIMDDFLASARRQVEKKRAELLAPLLEQEIAAIVELDKSYQKVGYANSTITSYLLSVRKLKDAQGEALALVGLTGADTTFTNTFVELSRKISAAVEKGKEIDVKSEEALSKLENVFSEIKKESNK